MAMVPDEALTLSSKDLKGDYPSLQTKQLYLLRLCHAALPEDFLSTLPEEPIPLFLAGPDGIFSHVSPGLTPGFVEAIAQVTGAKLDVKESRTYSVGRAGAFQAIEHAFEYMRVTGKEEVLVGGVDCFRDYLHLSRLDQEGRILYNGNTDGFAAGEGAAFILLSAKECPHEGSGKKIRLYSPGMGVEEGAIYGSAPYTGEGLSAAVKNALANHPGKHIKSIYSSMNGEQYWAKELGVAMTRHHSNFLDNVAIEHPADCFGDLGAAFGAVVLGYQANEDPGAYLIYGSSDSTFRAAMCFDITEL